MKKHVIILSILFFTIISTSLWKAGANSDVTIYVYTDLSPSNQSLLNFLNSSEYHVIIYNINDSSWENFSKIVDTLMTYGIKITSPKQELCPGCHVGSWKSFLIDYANPLIGYFRENRLVAITIGVTDVDTVKRILSLKNGKLYIFTRYTEYSFYNESMRVKLENLFTGEKMKAQIPSDIFFSIISLSAIDSINPCTFAVYTALLLISLNAFGKRKTFLTGFSFIIAVFFSYFLLGLGLIFLFSHIPYIDKMVAAFGLIFGAYGILLGIKPEFKSPIPKSISLKIDSWLKSMSLNLIASFLLGLLISFTLLPCSSGPYIVGMGLLSVIENEGYRYLLLLLYNLIFILPLVLILFLIIFFKNFVHKIKFFRSKKLGTMELVSGILLLLISVYLLVV